MSKPAPYDLPIYELDFDTSANRWSLASGEVTRFTEKCERYVTELTAEKKGGALTAVSVHSQIVRVTWAFFYARKGAHPAEHAGLLTVFLATLEQLHELWYDVEPANVIRERVVHVPSPSSWQEPRSRDPEIVLPRDPMQAAIRFDEI
jgi:hypothetical protein